MEAVPETHAIPQARHCPSQTSDTKPRSSGCDRLLATPATTPVTTTHSAPAAKNLTRIRDLAGQITTGESRPNACHQIAADCFTRHRGSRILDIVTLDFRDLKGALSDLDRTLLTELRQGGYDQDTSEQLTALDHADRLISQIKQLLDDHREDLTTPDPPSPSVAVSRHYGGG